MTPSPNGMTPSPTVYLTPTHSKPLTPEEQEQQNKLNNMISKMRFNSSNSNSSFGLPDVNKIQIPLVT